MAVKPKALFISAHAPSESATQAGHKTANHYLSQLKKIFDVDVVILFYGNTNDISMALVSDRNPTIFHFDHIQRVTAILHGLIRRIPPRFATRFHLKAARYVNNLIRCNRYTIVWLEFSQVFWLTPRIARSKVDGETILLSTHDIQAELLKRKSWLERVLFLKWTLAYERKIFNLADKIRVQSEKDMHFVRQACGSSTIVEVVPPFVSCFVQRVRRNSNAIQRHSLLFWGAMNRTENYSAVLQFASNVLPGLRHLYPDTRLLVVGANPPAALQALASSWIEVTGYVDDPTSYFERASLGVVPLLQGAGIKVKTLEMLQSGLTVVTTPIGAEGIAPCKQLIVTEISKMGATISRLWLAQQERER